MGRIKISVSLLCPHCTWALGEGGAGGSEVKGTRLGRHARNLSVRCGCDGSTKGEGLSRVCTAHECVAPSTLKGNTNHDVLGVFVVVPRHVALALPVRASHALPATVARRRAHQQLPVRGAAPHHSDTIRWHGGGRYRQAGKASTRPGMRDVGSAHMQACCGLCRGSTQHNTPPAHATTSRGRR